MQLSCNGVSLEIEDHGPPSGEPLLLVMGLGMQLLAWPLPFVESLVARGFRVIRFDNRDIGLSRSFDELGVPNLTLAAMKAIVGLRVQSGYSLSNMAADSVGVLDALGIQAAHVCGASMGGMIAQRMAAEHPERVKSLTLIMTTSGSRRLPGPSLAVQRAMLAHPDAARGVEGIVDHYVRLYALIGSPGYPPAPAELRAPARSLDPALVPAAGHRAATDGHRGRRQPLSPARADPPTDAGHPRCRRRARAGGGGARSGRAHCRRRTRRDRRHGPRPAGAALATFRERHRERGSAHVNG